MYNVTTLIRIDKVALSSKFLTSLHPSFFLYPFTQTPFNNVYKTIQTATKKEEKKNRFECLKSCNFLCVTQH